MPLGSGVDPSSLRLGHSLPMVHAHLSGHAFGTMERLQRQGVGTGATVQAAESQVASRDEGADPECLTQPQRGFVVASGGLQVEVIVVERNITQ